MGTVVIGSNTGKEEVPLVTGRIVSKEIRYQGVNTHDTPAVRTAIKLIASSNFQRTLMLLLAMKCESGVVLTCSSRYTIAGIMITVRTP